MKVYVNRTSSYVKLCRLGVKLKKYSKVKGQGEEKQTD